MQTLYQEDLGVEIRMHTGTVKHEISSSPIELINGYGSQKLSSGTGGSFLDMHRDSNIVFKTELLQRCKQSKNVSVQSLLEFVIQVGLSTKVAEITHSLTGMTLHKSIISRWYKDLSDKFINWLHRPLVLVYPDLTFDARYARFHNGENMEIRGVLLVKGYNCTKSIEILAVDVKKYYNSCIPN